MWITGTGADVLHCQHCKPSVTWVVYKPGEAPQFAYTGFPADGQIVLSKQKIILMCKRCTPGIDVAVKDFTRGAKQAG